MQVKVKKVDLSSEERAEIHAVSITEEIRNAIDLLEHNQQSIPVTGSGYGAYGSLLNKF